MKLLFGKRISNTSYFFCGQRILLILFIAYWCQFLSLYMVKQLALPSLGEVSLHHAHFRAMDFSKIDLDALESLSGECGMKPEELLLCAMMNGLSIGRDDAGAGDGNISGSGEVKEISGFKPKDLLRMRNRMLRTCEDYDLLTGYLKALWEEILYFPVAHSMDSKPFVEFVDSWGMERTFGGKRMHEGCDLMALRNERGLYPVVSVCDGVVANMGWLLKGGWRIGILSSSGVYYYYAHLEEYADLKVGDTVRAGDLLGFMGDSGYGPEGTRGMFDVHLHFGIYLMDREGKEISVNPYWWMVLKKNKVLYFDY